MMKYKIGDRVIIKKNDEYISYAQKRLREFGYVATIKEVENSFYLLEEIKCYWEEEDIEELFLSVKEFFEPITIRFELMEL